MIRVELVASAEDIFLRILTEYGSVEADWLLTSLRRIYIGINTQRRDDATTYLADGAVARTGEGTDAGTHPGTPTDVTIAQLDPDTNGEAYAFMLDDHGAAGAPKQPTEEAVGEFTGQSTGEVVQEEPYRSPGGLAGFPDHSSNHNDLSPPGEEWLQDGFDIDDWLEDSQREEPLTSHVEEPASSSRLHVTLSSSSTDITSITGDNINNVPGLAQGTSHGLSNKTDHNNGFTGAISNVTAGTSAGTSATVPSRKSTGTSLQNPSKPIIERRTHSTRSCRSERTKSRIRASRSIGVGQLDRLLTLREHWECLRSIGLFHTAPHEILQWDADTIHMQCMSDLFRGYDHVLDQVGKTDALHPWRRAMAQYRTLQCFEQLVEDIKERQAGGGFPGGTARNRAHKEYTERTCPDADLEKQTRCKKRLDINLRFARKWKILIEGPEKKGETSALGLGEGVILATTPEMFRIINDTDETHASVERLLHDIHEDETMPAVCQILQPAAQSLLRHHRLTADMGWASIRASLQRVIKI